MNKCVLILKYFVGRHVQAEWFQWATINQTSVSIFVQRINFRQKGAVLVKTIVVFKIPGLAQFAVIKPGPFSKVIIFMSADVDNYLLLSPLVANLCAKISIVYFTFHIFCVSIFSIFSNLLKKKLYFSIYLLFLWQNSIAQIRYLFPLPATK